MTTQTIDRELQDIEARKAELLKRKDLQAKQTPVSETQAQQALIAGNVDEARRIYSRLVAENPKDTQLAERAKVVLDAAAPAEGEVRKRTPLDISSATPICFTADIIASPKARDESLVGKNLWFKGVRGAKGPQGGVYLNGRVVIGFKGAQVKGWMKLGDKHLDSLMAEGGTMECWVQLDGEREQRLFGTLTNYKAKPVEVAEKTA